MFKLRLLLSVFSTIISLSSALVIAENLHNERIPAKIQTMAAPRAEQKYSKVSDRELYVEGFAEGYRNGLTIPSNATVSFGSGKNEPFEAGENDGLNAALDYAAKGQNPITLIDFGYEEVTKKGYVFIAFEQSEFRPLDSEEIWWLWLSNNCEIKYSEPVRQEGKGRIIEKDGKQYIDSRRVIATLRGFLSPKSIGRYGHMGAYEREFVATKTLDVKLVKDSAK